MSALEAKIRCPKCHGRFFVPLDEIGRDTTTPCPNCGTKIQVKARPGDAATPGIAPPATPKAQRVAGDATRAGGDAAVCVSAPADVPVAGAEKPPRPWWKFWARD